MDENFGREKGIKIIRIWLIITGVVFIVVALLADVVGIGDAGSLGSGQILLIVFGGLILSAGILGRSFKNFFHSLAIILLITFLILGTLELSTIAIARLNLFPSYTDITHSRYLELPYYLEHKWSEEYWLEARQAEKYRYQPFVVWRHQQFEGTHVNINQDGIRITPRANCVPDAFTVYIFGGSSMWGWGSPDWGTIPAFLQAGLDELIEGPVCVVNMGEDAYVSTQSLVSLTIELQKGRVPDVVIFLDGVNDVFVAYESGEPGVHPMLADISARFEGQGNNLLNWLTGTRLFWLAKNLTQRIDVYEGMPDRYQDTSSIMDQDIDELAYEVIERYLGNYNLVYSLASEYGFQSFFFWQPHITVGEKELTSHELDMRIEISGTLSQLVNQSYDYINHISKEFQNIHYIADLFDDRAEQIWIDSWGHVTPEGNKLIANEMIVLMRDHLIVEKE
jgi:lysophospholipase L1-like esterase